jgi:hypothetical protein
MHVTRLCCNSSYHTKHNYNKFIALFVHRYKIYFLNSWSMAIISHVLPYPSYRYTKDCIGLIEIKLLSLSLARVRRSEHTLLLATVINSSCFILSLGR